MTQSVLIKKIMKNERMFQIRMLKEVLLPRKFFILMKIVNMLPIMRMVNQTKIFN